MEEETRNNRVEAVAWCAGTLLVTALTVYTTWHNARRNERLAGEAHGAQQVAPTSTGTPQAR